ncbi:phage tail tape measure protein [Paenibacillus dendritiformis]|uniref:phage tail tape measure protein n=1 Tax=Paenibacillus dendritiformis TaxID=130049 RepID=UPI0015EBF78F|nr:phage tail tape measure protein [Paenibacillus dendritiformis]
MGGLSSLFKLSVIMSMVDQITPAATKASQSISRLRDTFNSAGEAMTKAGQNLTTKVSLPLAGVGTFALHTGMQFDSQMSKVQAISGATGESLDKLRAQAKDLGAATAFTATQAAEGMEYLALAGWKTEAILEAMPGMLNLAQAGALDLGRAADITSDTMQAFGMSADKATHAADVFAYAQANANTNVEQLGEAMKYLAPVANQLGWGLEESSAAMMAVADSGLKGSMAGAAFATSLGRLAKPTKRMSDMMNQLGLEFFDANGVMKSMPDIVGELEKGLTGMTQEQRSAAITTLFGAEAYKHWAILAERGSGALQDMTSSLENADGTAQKMAGTMMDNLGGSVTSLKSAVEGAALSIYELGSGPIRNIVDRATEWVRAFINLDERTKNIIVIVGGIAAALGPLLMMLGMVTKAVGTLMPVLGFLVSPIGLIIAAIAGVVAAFVYLNGGIDGTKKVLAGWFNALKAWWKSDGTQAWVSRIVAVFKQFVAQISQAFNWIMQQVRIYWPVVQNTVVQVFQYIRTNVLPVVMEIAKNVGGMFVRIWAVAKPLLQQLLTTWIKSFKQIWAAVQPLAVTLGRVFKTVFPIVLQAVAAIYKAVTTYLPPVLAFVGEIFVSIYQAVVPIITDVVTSVIQAFNAVLNWALAIWPYVQQIIAGVFQYIQWVWAFIGPYVMAAIEILKSIIMNGFNFIAATIQFIWTTIKSIIMIAWSIISGVIKTALALFTGDWQGAWDGIKGIVEGVWEGIKTFFGGIGTWLYDSGKAIITTLVDGIKSAANAPVEAVKNIFGKVREFLPFSDAKVGPLSDLTYSGSKIPGTIAEGVAKGARQLRAAAHNMMEGLGLDRAFAFRLAPEAPASVPMPEVQRQPVSRIAQASSVIEAGIRSGIARLRSVASAIIPGFEPALAMPGGGAFLGDIPEYPPFPAPPAPDYDPTPPAPAPGAGRTHSVKLREVFRETSVERETIREKGGSKPPITVNIYGGSEKQRRDLLDVLERFNEQNRE